MRDTVQRSDHLQWHNGISDGGSTPQLVVHHAVEDTQVGAN